MQLPSLHHYFYCTFSYYTFSSLRLDALVVVASCVCMHTCSRSKRIDAPPTCTVDTSFLSISLRTTYYNSIFLQSRQSLHAVSHFSHYMSFKRTKETSLSVRAGLLLLLFKLYRSSSCCPTTRMTSTTFSTCKPLVRLKFRCGTLDKLIILFIGIVFGFSSCWTINRRR